MWPTNSEDQLAPSGLQKMWLSDSDLRSSSFNEEQSNVMVSFRNDNEITVASTEEAGVDTTETAEQPASKRNSYWLALGKRVLSAGRKLFCCGGCRRKKRQKEKTTK